MKSKLVLSLAVLFLARMLPAQTAHEVVTRYIDAIGGAEKWKSITSIECVGKISTPEGDIPLILYRKVPNKLKLVLTFQDQNFVMNAFDGTTGWYQNPMQGNNIPTKMDEEQNKDMALEAFEDSYIDYKKKGHAITLEGKEEIEGTTCFKIRLEKNKHNDKDDITEYHYIDAEKYMPVLQKTFVRSGPTKGAEIQTAFSNYQDVDGVKMPFQIEQRINGQPMGTVTVEKFVLNNVEDSVFAFPN